MQVINRSEHTIDYRRGLRDRKRMIRNNANYKTPGGLIVPTRSAVEFQSIKPPDWAGVWDFSHAQLEAPLQVHVRDDTDPGNRAMLGINPAKRPDVWATWKVMNANSVEPVFGNEGRRVDFAGLWDGCDWGLDILPHSLKDTITIKDKIAAPAVFRWTIKVAPGCTLQARANGIHLLDSDGTSHGWISYPTAWDDNGSQLNPNIRVTMALGAPVGALLTMIITPNAVDVAASVGDVVIDPTTTISGAPGIEDNMLRSASPTVNWGGHALIIIRRDVAPAWRGIIRVTSANIPAGSISRSEMFLSRSTGGDTVRSYAIAAANGDWGEGTGTGGVAGPLESSYSWRANPAAWAGSDGLRTSGTDFDPTPFDSQLYQVGSAYAGLQSDPAVAEYDRDNPGNNRGVMLGNIVDAGTNEVRINSTEGINPPYWEYDYTAGPSGLPISFFDRRS